MASACNSLMWFPISVFVLLPSTFILSYVIAVALNHVEADFPYISDTGTHSPESCIFGQLLNIGAVLIGITAYIRYKHVKSYAVDRRRLNVVNNVSFVFGLLSAFGISMVGNFQETNVLAVHETGALLAFGLGTVYCWIHTVISYRLRPVTAESRLSCHVRVVLCVVASVSFVTLKVFASISRQKFHGKDPRKWLPSDGGFPEHVVSAASEWTLCVAQITYFLTFVPEFKGYTMTTPELVSRNDRVDERRALLPALG